MFSRPPRKTAKGWYAIALSGLFLRILSVNTKSPIGIEIPPASKRPITGFTAPTANPTNEKIRNLTKAFNVSFRRGSSVAIFFTAAWPGVGMKSNAKSRRKKPINIIKANIKFGKKALTNPVLGRSLSKPPSLLIILWEVVDLRSSEKPKLAWSRLLAILVNANPSLVVQSKWLWPAAAWAGATISGPQASTIRNETSIPTIWTKKPTTSTLSMNGSTNWKKGMKEIASKISCVANMTPEIINPGRFQPNHQQVLCPEFLCA